MGWGIVRRETNQGGWGEGKGAPTSGPRATPSLTWACRRRRAASAALPLPAALDAERCCYDFQCQELPAIFLGFHDVFFLHASEEPEPVKSDG
jgi:hypothetical protein